MRKDVRAVWDPLQKELFENQINFEKEILTILKSDRRKAIDVITNYCFSWQVKVVDRCWQLFEDLLTKYDEFY